ncbi:putative metal-dependent hydrolase, TIM-barrel fold [Goodfellowiella coeruleoviolacea]|uniref:Metal-dependent hydrolase, TIM-barrel fold n=2 Tax=Goodfellowiella coeruleoviolacea TaxID=334858 RepID=A0AAE3GKD8_9PSEU|nr:putative metal-dependent hydrolase, TIM-barrel fold [Goodfellowiella coeruleoviolacea]
MAAKGAAVVTAATAGVFSLAGDGSATAAGDDDRDRRVDVHHHCLTPAWLAWAEARGVLDRDELRWWVYWDVADTLSMMDAAGIATAVMSVRTPIVHPQVDDALHRESLRVAYQSVAEVVAAHPGRFAFLAQVRLDNLELARWSARYALRAGAVGVQFHTHDLCGRYLGDPAFDPLLAELSAETAVAVVHPADLPGTTRQQPAVPGVPNFMCDYLLATTRVGLSMTMHRTLDRFPRLSFVLPHGGGFLPYIAARVRTLGGQLSPAVDPGLLRDYLCRFHYDTAAPMSPDATPTLLATVGSARLLYGSDWPALTREQVLAAATALDTDPALTPVQRARINRGNALALFPSLG